MGVYYCHKSALYLTNFYAYFIPSEVLLYKSCILFCVKFENLNLKYKISINLFFLKLCFYLVLYFSFEKTLQCSVV